MSATPQWTSFATAIIKMKFRAHNSYSHVCRNLLILALKNVTILFLLFEHHLTGILASSESSPDGTNVNAMDEKERQIPDWRLSFQTYEGPDRIINYGSNLAALNTFMTWTEIGKTQQNKTPIHLATIRNPKKKQKRAIFVDALMTANTYQSASIATYIMDQLMFNSSHHMDILDSVTFYIVPVLNLDSYTVNYNNITNKYQDGPHTPQRGQDMAAYEILKNLRQGPKAPSCVGIACEPGVNIATNFPFKWEALPARVIREFSGSAGFQKYIFHFNETRSIHYRGDGPCSESECQAVVKFIKEHKEIDTYVTLQGFSNFWGLPYAYAMDERPENYDEIGKLAAAVTESINEGSRETSQYGPWWRIFDLGQFSVYNGKEHPGNPMDWAKSVGIRFTFWAGFGEDAYARYVPGPDVERVNRAAWKGFLVLARLKDKYGRPVFPSGAARVGVGCEAALLMCAFLGYFYAN